VIELYNSNSENGFVSSPVHLKTDGVNRSVEAGGKVVLTPGESICLEQGMYHKFYGETGKGKVLVGEVSMVNDDASDNCFYEKVGRFPQIVEDEQPLHLLVGDYANFLK
jgi:D-lyxose ketol-isomerase